MHDARGGVKPDAAVGRRPRTLDYSSAYAVYETYSSAPRVRLSPLYVRSLSVLYARLTPYDLRRLHYGLIRLR